MKKFLFALPILAIAVFLSYCAKETSPTTGIQNEQQVDNPAADRATCNVTITSSANVNVCGLGTFGSCQSCSGNTLPGTAFGTAFGYTVTPPALGTPFSISNPGSTKVTVRIDTGTVCGIWVLAPGQCMDFTLASTCYLVSTVAPLPC